jgi:hypothetical protein
MAVERSFDDQVWRVSPTGRGGAVSVALIWLVLVVLISTERNTSAGVIALLWIVLIVVGVGVWLWAFRPYVALTTQAVVVQNRITKRTVPYGTILDVKPGYYGLRLVTKNQADVTIWAVQKSNVSKWGNRRTRADEVAAAIRAKVSAA